MANTSTGQPGPLAQPLVVKPFEHDQLDTLVTCRTTKKSSHVICWSVAIRCHGPTGPDVRPLVSLVVNNAVMDGLVATRMMYKKVAHVKQVMVSTRIGHHGRPARKHVRVAINNVFDRTHVVNSMNVAFVVN